MPRSRLRQTLLIGFMLLAAPPSMAAMFTLRPGTSLYSRPGFRMTHRLDLRSEEIVVEGPAIEQRAVLPLPPAGPIRTTVSPRESLGSLLPHLPSRRKPPMSR